MNTQLSEDRAKSVITYLVQQGNVPIRHIVAPGAMGEYGAAAPNETKAGRAENRRVEVKVPGNNGVAGSFGKPSGGGCVAPLRFRGAFLSIELGTLEAPFPGGLHSKSAEGGAPGPAF